MKSIDTLKDAHLREVLARVKSAVTAFAGDDVRLILYGSRARGDAREDSDTDIMVVIPDEKYNFATQDHIRDLIYDIGDAHDIFFQVFVAEESSTVKYAGFMVFDSVEKEGLLV